MLRGCVAPLRLAQCASAAATLAAALFALAPPSLLRRRQPLPPSLPRLPWQPSVPALPWLRLPSLPRRPPLRDCVAPLRLAQCASAVATPLRRCLCWHRLRRRGCGSHRRLRQLGRLGSLRCLFCLGYGASPTFAAWLRGSPAPGTVHVGCGNPRCGTVCVGTAFAASTAAALAALAALAA